MLDEFGLPQTSHCVATLHTPQGSANPWQKWVKPSGYSMCYILAVGAGSGGGGGYSASAAVGCGGGGGGSGAIARIVTPMFLMPDMLFVQPGVGGSGGAAGAGGTAGGLSYVSIGPHDGAVASFITAQNLVLMSGAAGPIGGGAGAAASGGTAGAAGTIALNTGSILGAYAPQWYATVGLIGAIGGLQTTGTNSVNVIKGVSLSGGAGGAGQLAGTNYAGGNTQGSVAGNNRIPTVNGGAVLGGAGGHGLTLMNPFMSCGGAGGGSYYLATKVGGVGGNGGWGSGGGGGGSGATGGTGGKGGDGFILIVCW